jgi:Tfp pilus assembly protein PilN
MKAVNLLPSDLRGAGKPAPAAVAPGAEAAGRAGAFAVLGVLAFSVVALAAYVLASNTVKDRQAQLKQVSAQAVTVTQRAAKLKPYADFQTAALARVQTVKDLAGARFDWEQALRDLARAVPSDVTLTSMTGSISSAPSGGAASDPMRGAIGAPAVSLEGCTRNQRAVATMLSRLRAVRGVTRVTLSKSERPDRSSTTVTTGTSTATNCVGKRPPTFSVVLFFEHASVPATVADVNVAAPAAAAKGTGASTTTSTTTGASGTGTTTPTTPASTPTG